MFIKNMVKSLFKLARNILFHKEFYCEYCNMIETDKEDVINHIKIIHDEYGKVIKLFLCKKCGTNLNKTEILNHMTIH